MEEINITSNQQYDASQIEVLEELEAVRKRPGMYIGDTGRFGLHHLVSELIDNAVDEIINSHGDHVEVTHFENNFISVSDNGRGIPVDVHERFNQPAAELIFTKLHSGAKFNDNVYLTSGGLHGVGTSVVNALSKHLEVLIMRNKKTYKMNFACGKMLSGLEVIGTSTSTGTQIKFQPDPDIFGDLVFNDKIIMEQLKEKAFLSPGIKFIFTNKIPGNEAQTVFCFPKGIVEFVSDLMHGYKKLGEVAFFEQQTPEKISIKIALGFVDNDNLDETIYSFANCVHTRAGGTHEIGFKAAITRAFNDYIQTNETYRKLKNIDGVIIRQGLFAVLDLRIPEKFLQFEGQTKEKLTTPLIRSLVESITYDKMHLFLIEHPITTKLIMQRIMRELDARQIIAKQRLLMKTKRSRLNNDSNFHGKLSPAHTKNPVLRELFIVEGESAGGSAKQGRDSAYQAILPLKGKIINAAKSSMMDMLNNEEIMAIINVIDAGFREDFNVQKIKYHKVIIMTDADDDGAHIQALLLTFFYRYMTQLIQNGHLFLASPPLFKIQTNKEEFYAYNDLELKSLLATLKPQPIIQRYKGLGEMNPEQLWQTTMNPKTRKLIKINLKEDQLIQDCIRTLMGNDIEQRKLWIEENIDFTALD